MSNTAYFIGLLQQLEVVKASSLLSDEERGVFAAQLLYEIKPEMMTRGCEGPREIIVRNLKKLSDAPSTTPKQRREAPQSEVGVEPKAQGSDEPQALTGSETRSSQAPTVLDEHGPPVHAQGSRKIVRKGKGQKARP